VVFSRGELFEKLEYRVISYICLKITKTMQTHDNFLIFNDMPTSEMSFVKGGTFKMGSNDNEREKPIHDVSLNAYWIGTFPVTQALWKKVMDGANPSYFKGDNRPVENVSWNEITTNFLLELENKTGKKYRLPTEAEWEYAAKGGTHWQNNFRYAGSNDIDEVAWFGDNSHRETKPVGLKAPNQLGLFDMSGNVWEWCSDYYSSYSSASKANPTGAVGGTNRVMRGGSWNLSSGYCRPSYRNFNEPAGDGYIIGFRLVCPFQSVG
jgi:formylglycine-generating enzyme